MKLANWNDWLTGWNSEHVCRRKLRRAREVPVVVLPRPTRAMVQEAGEEESDWLGCLSARL